MTGEHASLRYENLTGEEKAAVNRYLKWVVEVQEPSLADRHPVFKPLMNEVNEGKLEYSSVANMLLASLSSQHPGKNVMDFIMHHEPSCNYQSSNFSLTEVKILDTFRTQGADKVGPVR